MTQVRRQSRTAFTLVEILIVVLIIALIVSISIPVYQVVLKKGGEVKCKTDIAQLEGAVQAFMSHYNVNYIPSRIRLCAKKSTYGTTTLDQDSIGYLTKLFPKIQNSSSPWMTTTGAGINWTNHPLYTVAFSGVAGSGSGGVSLGDETLEGHQCLVFFLGGIQSVSPASPGPGVTYTATCTGFSNNLLDPSSTSSTTDRTPPFFDFQPAQLTFIPHFSAQIPAATDAGNISMSSLFHDQGFVGGWGGTPHGTPTTGNLSNAVFLSYLDSYRTQPYAYFSSYKASNGYNRYAGTTTFPGTTIPLIQDNASLLASVPGPLVPPLVTAATATGGALSIQPYASVVSGTTPTAFYKPERYQIISAGVDGKWGLPPAVGGAVNTSVATAYGLWLSDGTNCTPDGADDMSNFTGGKMSSGQ